MDASPTAPASSRPVFRGIHDLPVTAERHLCELAALDATAAPAQRELLEATCAELVRCVSAHAGQLSVTQSTPLLHQSLMEQRL